LALSSEDRAQLAVSLLASLEEAAESPEAIEKLWVAECERRFQEFRDGVEEGIPAEKVFAELRSRRP
jgi:putative addiction module component (TIGR02574 family)